MRPLLNVLDFISEYSGRLFAFLSIPVIAVIMIEVLGRYFFNHPFIWSHELMTFLSAFIYLMGGAYILKERGHISVDLVYKYLPVRGKAIMDLIVSAFFFLYMAVLLRVGTNYALTSIRIFEKSGTPWNPPVYPIKAAIALAVILLLVAGIANFIRDLRVAVTGKEEEL